MTKISNMVATLDLAEAARLLTRKHRHDLKRGETITLSHERDVESESITLDVVDGGQVFRFEAQVHLADVRNVEESQDILLDFLDGVVQEWLEGGREAYPTLDFSPYEFMGITVGLRGGAHRPDLEAAADALLGPELDPKDPQVN